jgi:folylpolyglutamate synthase/dihydrofolate synthase
MDPRIPTRVVVCDSAQPAWASIDLKQNGHHSYPHGAPPHHYAPPPHGYPPIPGHPPIPGQQYMSGSPMQPVHASGNVYINRPQPRSQVMSVAHISDPAAAGYESKRPSIVPQGSRADKIDLTLGHMRRLMSHLPPLMIPAIHLAGTNGKGSVSAIIDSILTVAGLRTARYNSPHLIEARDAIRIAGVPPPRKVYDTAVGTIRHIAAQRQIEVSPFELATAAAYYMFATAQPPIDVMIIECGMGGVNDATNVIPPAYNLASGLTSVGLDHTTFLGDSIAAIADQKARITVPGGLLVTAPNLAPEALQVAHGIGYQLRAAVIEAGLTTVIKEDRRPFSLSPFVPPQPVHVRTRIPVILDGRLVPGEDYVATRLPLGGQHQLDNLSLALTIVHVLSHDKRALSIQPALARVTPPIMQRGVEATKWEGRCSWLQYKIPGTDRSIPVLVDGAHNADSAKTLRAYINELGAGIKVHFVISLSSSPGKSPESVLRPLLGQGDKVTLVDFTTPVEGMPWVKPASKDEVKDVVNTLISSEAALVDQPGVEGLKQILGGVGDDELVVVCGSLYLVADVYRLANSA